MTELPCPPRSPHSTQVEGALSGIKESVHATPTPLQDAEQSMEGPEAKPQPSTPKPATEEDTCPKVLIRGEQRKVPDAYPKYASGCSVTSNSLMSWPSSW